MRENRYLSTQPEGSPRTAQEPRVPHLWFLREDRLLTYLRGADTRPKTGFGRGWNGGPARTLTGGVIKEERFDSRAGILVRHERGSGMINYGGKTYSITRRTWTKIPVSSEQKAFSLINNRDGRRHPVDTPGSDMAGRGRDAGEGEEGRIEYQV